MYLVLQGRFTLCREPATVPFVTLMYQGILDKECD